MPDIEIINIDHSELTSIGVIGGVHVFGTDRGELLCYRNVSHITLGKVNKEVLRADPNSRQQLVYLFPELPPPSFNLEPAIVDLTTSAEIEAVEPSRVIIPGRGRTIWNLYVGFGPKSKQWVFFGLYERFFT